MAQLAAFLGFDDPKIAAAWIAAGVSLAVTLLAAPLRLFVERHLQRQKVAVEYEYGLDPFIVDSSGRLVS